MTNISETVSEKPLRGRPPAFSAEWMTFLKSLNPEVRTRRGLLNVAYRQEAMRMIGDLLEAYPDDLGTLLQLADHDRMKAGDPDAWQPTILADLGRCADPDVFVMLAMLAVRLLDMQRPVAKVVHVVRAWRLSGMTADELAVAWGIE